MGAGILISRSMLGRIEAVTEASRKIMAGDLSRRVPLNGSGDELDRLSESLNAMLARIEELMAALREVSDNIAHDLKTPLTRLRNRAEAALREPDSSAAHRDGLVKTIEEADELIKTFNALLLIARLEGGAMTEAMAPASIRQPSSATSPSCTSRRPRRQGSPSRSPRRKASAWSPTASW